jgi:hypothetical protein
MVSTINSFFSSVLQEFFPNHYMMTGGAPGTGSGTTTGSGIGSGSGSGTTTGSGNNTTSSDNKATTGGSTVPESTDNDDPDTPTSFSSPSTDSEDLDTFSNPNDSVEDRISQLEEDMKRLMAKKDDFLTGKIDPLPGKTREESAEIYNEEVVFKLQEKDALEYKPNANYVE